MAPVALTPQRPAPEGHPLDWLAAAAHAADGDAPRALDLARTVGEQAPRPGQGQTRALFETLATMAAADLTAARIAEAHLDALAILDQCEQTRGDRTGSGPAELAPANQSWGVFAAEGATERLRARHLDGHWVLTGTKPWCSLAGSLSHALVTGHTAESSRRLFAVTLADPGVTVQSGAWVSRGLVGVPSGPVDFNEVPAVPVGDDDWYLRRPGFAWGGIGVAAVWWGGAIGVARELHRSTQTREPDQIALAHLGAIDVSLAASAAALAAAATAIDAGLADGTAGALLAARVRGLVARTVEDVITRVGHALGPAPLALDDRHARRVADLQLYVRQHHAERDDATLGRMLVSQAGLPW